MPSGHKSSQYTCVHTNLSIQFLNVCDISYYITAVCRMIVKQKAEMGSGSGVASG